MQAGLPDPHRRQRNRRFNRRQMGDQTTREQQAKIRRLRDLAEKALVSYDFMAEDDDRYFAAIGWGNAN